MKFIQELQFRVQQSTYTYTQDILYDESKKYTQYYIYKHVPLIMEKCRSAANSHQYSIEYVIEDNVLLMDSYIKKILKQELGKEMIVSLSRYYDENIVLLYICWARFVGSNN